MKQVLLPASVALTLGLAACSPGGSSPKIELQLGDSVRSYTAMELAARVKPARLTITNPQMAAGSEAPPFEYEGVWLRDLLAMEVPDVAAGGARDELQITCLDGYAPTVPWEKLTRNDFFLAWSEVPAGSAAEIGALARSPSWTPFLNGKEKLTAGPFYLVARQPETFKVPGWPFQIARMEAVTFKKKYPHLAPASDSAQVRAGFATFKQSCLKCHSINLEGGVLGPELNVPRNVTEYRDAGTLRAFIQDASSFRARSKMPSFKKLSPAELDSLLAYLKQMARQKETVSAEPSAAP